MPRKKGINSREKGKKGERELAEYLRGFGFNARRGQQFSGGGDSPDVIADLPNFHIECKRCERGRVYDWLAQAKRDAKKKTPLVFHRKNGQEWCVILSASDFLAFMALIGM